MVTVVGFFLVGNHENDGLVTFATFVLQKVWKKLARVPPYFFLSRVVQQKVHFCNSTKWHGAIL